MNKPSESGHQGDPRPGIEQDAPATLVGPAGREFASRLRAHILGLEPVSSLGTAASYGSDGVLEITIDRPTSDVLGLTSNPTD